MCLAIPGKVADLYEACGAPMARVDFGGITREACMAYLPDARSGDYVLVHAGFAISRVDEEEARRTLEDLQKLGELAAEDESPDSQPPAPA